MEKDIYIKYFSHDVNSRHDPKIKNMLFHFRKESQEKAQAAVCIYWWIIEDMHQENYKVADVEAYADDYRCDVDFLKSILNDFDLFRIENDCYISNRVLRNIQEQEEKTKKAKEAVNKRWKNKIRHEQSEESVSVDSIIEIFNKEFGKTQTVGKETKEKIISITKENNLTLETWQKIFSNAQRGWDIGGKIKKPSLKTILESWDSFASDDYYLAPDIRKQARENEILKEEERLKEEEENQKIAEYDKERKEAYNDIHNKETAIEYLNKYFRLPEAVLQVSDTFKKLSQVFQFTANDVIYAREENWKI